MDSNQEIKVDKSISVTGLAKFNEALAYVYLTQPFVSAVLRRVNIRPSTDIPTMAVTLNRKKQFELLFNTEFCDKFEYEDNDGNKKVFEMTPFMDIAPIIVHEVYHLCMKHLERYRKDWNPKIMNYAADLVVNHYIPELRGEDGMGQFSINQPKFSKEAPNDFLKDVNIDEHSFESLYALFQTQMEKKKISADELEKMLANGTLKIGNHGGWEQAHDEIELSDEAKTRLEEIIKSAAKDAMQQGSGGGTGRTNSFGNLPGDLLKIIEQLLEPEPTWRSALNMFIASCKLNTLKTTWKKPSRRYGYAAKARLRDYKPLLMVAVDTSGSVFDEEILSEFSAFLDFAVRNCLKVRITSCDTQITFDEEFRQRDTSWISKVFRGGGGTDMNPIYERAKEHGVDGVILLTDGYMGEVHTHGVPTIALIIPGGVPPPGIKRYAELRPSKK